MRRGSAAWRGRLARTLSSEMGASAPERTTPGPGPRPYVVSHRLRIGTANSRSPKLPAISRSLSTRRDVGLILADLLRPFQPPQGNFRPTRGYIRGAG